MKKLFLFAVVLILILTGCKSDGKVNEYRTSIFAMDTYITIDFYGEKGEETAEEVSNKIKEIEELWSTTLADSEIYEINNNQGTPVTISDETKELITYALDMADKTNGALNPTLYPIIKKWGFTTGNYNVPSQNEIDNLLKNTDYKKISIENNQVLIDENMELDLGAVGKGYAGDIVSDIAKKNGISSGLINLGGNVQLIGTKADGSKWKLGLQNPFGEDNIGILEVADCAVVTSGNYERYFVGSDGKRYCHIINPYTGYPVDNTLVSVTVVGKEGKMCDAISTALFVMGKDKAVEYWKANKDFELILITEDKEIYITPNLEESFKAENFKTNIISGR